MYIVTLNEEKAEVIRVLTGSAPPPRTEILTIYK